MVNLDDILVECDVCGVGYIVSLKNEVFYKIVKDVFIFFGCMEYWGGCGVDNDLGDGVGVMISILWGFFKKWCKE